MDKYFSKFPYIYYSNTLCVDICRRVKINANREAQGDLNIYYPYEIVHHMRPDLISEYYYKDPEQDWLIYLTNSIVDPYYGWYLNDAQFNSLINTKYGDAATAQRTILYYRNNWWSDQTKLDPNFFENHLELTLKKYYQPEWGVGQTIIAYSRKPIDTIQNTNFINQYTITMTQNTFANNEAVDFSETLGGPSIGQGMVVGTYANNSTSLTLQSLSNTVTANSSYNLVITGFTTNAIATATATTRLYTNIPLDEEVFFSPVTAWDYEVENNEWKKNIELIGAGAQMDVSKQITKMLKINTNKSTNMTEE